MRLSCSAGAAVLAAALAAGIAMAQTAPPKGTISGVVTDTAGAPLADIPVAVSREAKTVTDAQGRYILKDLAPGRYPVVTGAHMRGKGSEAFRMVTLNAGQELKVDLRIELFGEITGMVVDENKEPAPGTAVVLVTREYFLGALRYRYASMGQTDDRGVYTLRRVVPGRPYLVMAGHRMKALPAISDVSQDPKLRKRVPSRTYFPDSPTIEGGELLVLRPGERREGVDIRLPKSQSYCFDGVLEAGGKAAALSFEVIEPGPTSGTVASGGAFIGSSNGKTGADGRVRVCDLYPGAYQVRVVQRGGPGDAPGFLGNAEVTIKDEDVHHVRVAARPKMTVPGELVWDGPAPEKPVDGKVWLMLRPLTRAMLWMGEADAYARRVAVLGDFVFTDVYMEEYQVMTPEVPKGLYVKDMTYGGASILHEPLRVGSALGGTLRIVMGRDGGTIGVQVSDRDGNAVPDVNVYLVPANAASEAMVQAQMVAGQTDQSGGYQSGLLAPGKYYVLASGAKVDASPESIGKLWRSRLRGKEVELAANGSAQITLEPVRIE